MCLVGTASTNRLLENEGSGADNNAGSQHKRNGRRLEKLSRGVSLACPQAALSRGISTGADGHRIIQVSLVLMQKAAAVTAKFVQRIDKAIWFSLALCLATRLTNVELCRALLMVKVRCNIGDTKSPATTQEIRTKFCKEGISADFYCHSRAILWNLLQILKRNIIHLTVNKASGKLPLSQDCMGSVAECVDQRVALVAQVGLLSERFFFSVH